MMRAPGTEPDLSERVEVSFEGRPLIARRGESIAAALTAAGIRSLRETQGELRGVFCGMGVCHDCLVTVDGVSGQRACMTKIDRPMAIGRQRALPEIAAVPPAIPEGPPALSPDLLVIGGGAAGLTAAALAAEAGLETLLVDERTLPGGQFYKQAVPGMLDRRARDRQFDDGRRLIGRVAASATTRLAPAEVVSAHEGLKIVVRHEGRLRLVSPRRLLVATGAYERPWPVKGWTLPGVMTTGAAQTLLRSYRVLAGRHIVVAGNGPLNLQVAVELIQAGARVEAVAELAPAPGWRDLAALLRMATSMPELLSEGRRYQKVLKRAGVPLLHATRLTAVERSESGLAAVLTDEAGEARRIDADAVLLGYGFLPSNEIMRMLGAAHRYDEGCRQLVTEVTPQGETSVAGLYAAGDCTGLVGAHAAAASGAIAAAAIIRSLGRSLEIGHRDEVAFAYRRRGDALRFQRGLWSLFAPRGLPLVPLGNAEPCCRCEFVTGARLAASIGQAAATAGTLKRATRTGMGRCQGRYCGEAVAAAAAELAGGIPDEAHRFAPRPALRPTAIAEVAGLADPFESAGGG